MAERRDHRPGVSLVDPQLAGDLKAREVQAHEIQAGDPDAQGLMMIGEDGAGQVVEPLPAGVAFVPLAMLLDVVAAVLGRRLRSAEGTRDAVGPPHVADGLEALGVVEEVLDVHHDAAAQMRGRVYDGETSDRSILSISPPRRVATLKPDLSQIRLRGPTEAGPIASLSTSHT